MSDADRDRWNAKYAAAGRPMQLVPDSWLVEQTGDLIPGRALELACGLGHNAIWLARQGWLVDAVDVSSVGLDRAKELASVAGVEVNWIAADLDEYVPAAAIYDVVVMFRFLDRARLPGVIEKALRPRGRLVYETFTTAHLLRPDSHMRNPVFALSPGELPRLFPNFELLSYQECSLADRAVARFVGRKRPT
jgi:2-polyprenyl-3-methyl-5-hydroxy-6-metoxy-1,4-benzoquinol methylase